MSPSFWLLQVESLDFCQAEKEKIACKAEDIHKMTLKIVFDEQSPHFE